MGSKEHDGDALPEFSLGLIYPRHRAGKGGNWKRQQVQTKKARGKPAFSLAKGPGKGPWQDKTCRQQLRNTSKKAQEKWWPTIAHPSRNRVRSLNVHPCKTVPRCPNTCTRWCHGRPGGESKLLSLLASNKACPRQPPPRAAQWRPRRRLHFSPHLAVRAAASQV